MTSINKNIWENSGKSCQPAAIADRSFPCCGWSTLPPVTQHLTSYTHLEDVYWCTKMWQGWGMVSVHLHLIVLTAHGQAAHTQQMRCKQIHRNGCLIFSWFLTPTSLGATGVPRPALIHSTTPLAHVSPCCRIGNRVRNARLWWHLLRGTMAVI